jgi:hypothetical protein
VSFEVQGQVLGYWAQRAVRALSQILCGYRTTGILRNLRAGGSLQSERGFTELSGKYLPERRHPGHEAYKSTKNLTRSWLFPSKKFIDTVKRYSAACTCAWPPVAAHRNPKSWW